MKYTVSENIKIIMERHNITITGLAADLGQSRQNLSKKFRENNFSLKDLEKICDILDVDYEVVFKERD